jgi:hypothetical protein
MSEERKLNVEQDPKLMANAAKLNDMTPFEFQRHLENERLEENARRRQFAENLRPRCKMAIKEGWDLTPYICDDIYMMRVWKDEQRKAGLL